MRSENIAYYIKFMRSQTPSMFNGNNEACSRYIEENLKSAVQMMDKYSESNNPWWLSVDENMAYHQLKEHDIMLVDYATFIDRLSRLLDRPIQSFEIGKNYNSLIFEAHEAYTDFMRAKIMHRYTRQNEQVTERIM